MIQVSFLLSLAFVIITFAAVYQFYNASRNSKRFLIIAVIWMLLQAIIGSTDFYTNGFTKPPRFVFMVLPPLALMLYIFFSTKGKTFLAQLDYQKLILLHIVRIPVEIVLYYLFLAKTIPQIMTFEGRNFDIFAGISALIIYFWQKKSQNKTVLLIWNFICLALLMNIVVISVLSAQTPFQQFGLEQPNLAIAHFPFNWLASVVVPLVMFAHLSSIKNLIK